MLIIIMTKCLHTSKMHENRRYKLILLYLINIHVWPIKKFDLESGPF